MASKSAKSKINQEPIKQDLVLTVEQSYQRAVMYLNDMQLSMEMHEEEVKRCGIVAQQDGDSQSYEALQLASFRLKSLKESIEWQKRIIDRKFMLYSFVKNEITEQQLMQYSTRKSGDIN